MDIPRMPDTVSYSQIITLLTTLFSLTYQRFSPIYFVFSDLEAVGISNAIWPARPHA